MIETIDHLLEEYERGKLTRRDLLRGIALLLTSPLQKSPVQGSVFKARSINHVNIRVADVNRSEAFYRKVLGFPPRRVVTPGTAFALDFPQGGFLSLCPLSANDCGFKSNAQPGDIDHFDVGIETFDKRRVMSKLKEAGFNEFDDGGTAPSVTIFDPDGTAVQLSAPDQTFPVAK